MHLFLLHDPDGDSRTILATYLRHLGHQVLDTDLAEDALALARKHRPDAVVTELGFPPRSDLPVLESLRLDPVTAEVPVVVWSSRVNPDTVRRVEGMGAAFVGKPASPSAVYRVLLEALEQPPDAFPRFGSDSLGSPAPPEP